MLDILGSCFIICCSVILLHMIVSSCLRFRLNIMQEQIIGNVSFSVHHKSKNYHLFHCWYGKVSLLGYDGIPPHHSIIKLHPFFFFVMDNLWHDTWKLKEYTGLQVFLPTGFNIHEWSPPISIKMVIFLLIIHTASISLYSFVDKGFYFSLLPLTFLQRTLWIYNCIYVFIQRL